MSRELRALLDSLNAKKTQGTELLANGKIDEAKAVMVEVKEIQAKIDIQKELEDDDFTPAAQMPLNPSPNPSDALNYADVFFKALKGKSLNADETALLEEHKALSSGTDEDGGYLIPTDVQTEINEYKRDFTDLSQFVNIEPVSTTSGSRVFEKEADSTPFTVFIEGADVPASDAPKFETVTYAIKDRGGFLPIPNNLLSDSAAKIKAHLLKWLKKKDKATRNSLILTILATFVKTDIETIKDIKKVLNVDLDPSIAASAIVITNQDGYNYLDSLEDADGKSLLRPDVTQGGAMTIKGKRIIYVSNKILPTTGTTTKKSPMIMGNLKEAITLFDREKISIASTNVGGDAFKKNRTDIRAINRIDCKKVDAKAVIYGELVIEKPVV